MRVNTQIQMSGIVFILVFKSLIFLMIFLSINQHPEREEKMCHFEIDKDIGKKNQMGCVTKKS